MNTNNIQKVNYQKILDKITDKIEKECAEGENRPALFLHACCAPCSSYVLEYLTKYFKITIFYYNPNITPETEYTKRVKELQRFIHEAGYEEDVTFVEGDYDPQVFFDMARGMEDLPERGLRCYHCYALRMEEAAKKAAEMGADYFSTTLSISPHKNAQWINEIGEKLADKYDTVGIKRNFTSICGNKVSVSGGTYGWRIDQKAETKNLVKTIKKGKSVKIKPEYAHRAKSRKKFDIGSTYVEVSLGEQHMWFYKNGKTLVSTDVVTGDISKGHGTPTGVYYILYKTTDYTLTGQGYASHVDYWLPFIQIGVGIHDSSWRGSYGGGIFTYDGSHGCVNTPRSAVQKIYNNIESTYPVVVHW